MTFKEYYSKIRSEENIIYLFSYFCDRGEIETKFNLSKDDILEVKILLGEMFQLSRGINDLLKSGNMISAIVLLRTLIERVILFRVIFEDKNKIEERLKIYIDFGYISAYLGLKDTNFINDDYFKECENKFNETGKIYFYKQNKYPDLYYGLFGEKESYNSLFKRYIENGLEKQKIIFDNSFYSIFSDIHHGNSLNKGFLNKNSFSPYYNEENETAIKYLIRVLGILIAEDLKIEIKIDDII